MKKTQPHPPPYMKINELKTYSQTWKSLKKKLRDHRNVFKTGKDCLSQRVQVLDVLITLKLKCMHIIGQKSKQVKRTHILGGHICNVWNHQRINIQNKHRTPTNVWKRQPSRKKMAKYMNGLHMEKNTNENSCIILNLINDQGMQIKTITCISLPCDWQKRWILRWGDGMDVSSSPAISLLVKDLKELFYTHMWSQGQDWSLKSCF